MKKFLSRVFWGSFTTTFLNLVTFLAAAVTIAIPLLITVSLLQELMQKGQVITDATAAHQMSPTLIALVLGWTLCSVITGLRGIYRNQFVLEVYLPKFTPNRTFGGMQ